MLAIIILAAVLLNPVQPVEEVQDQPKPPSVHYQSPEFNDVVKKWFPILEMDEENFNWNWEQIEMEKRGIKHEQFLK